ncbi:ribokinase [Allorhizobium pseudoryzae]|uniref:ribokinase n=1 Tax=Allorhizobium pseudoryzae TaxID=379684 RepID=UPI003CFF3BCF
MRAFIIGNVALDETYSISALPEPGVSIFGTQASRDLGGKGCNQAIVMARCGVPTNLAAVIGEDDRATTIRETLAEEPVTVELISVAGVASDLSIILTTPDGENSVITTQAAAAAFTPDRIAHGLRAAKAGDLLVLQGNLTEAATVTALKLARQISMCTAFNPSPLQPWFPTLWPLIDIAFLNQSEAAALTNQTGQAAGRFLVQQGVSTVVLTLGGEGSMLVTADTACHVPATPAPAVDTTGAGDCFMGTALASALRRSCAIDEQALREAARASAITVGRRGTRLAFPTAEEMKEILSA